MKLPKMPARLGFHGEGERRLLARAGGRCWHWDTAWFGPEELAGWKKLFAGISAGGQAWGCLARWGQRGRPSPARGQSVSGSIPGLLGIAGIGWEGCAGKGHFPLALFTPVRPFKLHLEKCKGQKPT